MISNGRRVVAAMVLCAVSGCASGGSSSGGSSSTQPAPAAAAPAAAAPKRPIPAGSPFAKVKEKMGSDEVYATIGKPTSEERYITGKGFIPFNFGGDKHRMTAHYKGIGTITFSSDGSFTSGMSVMSIDYDPDEPGFAKKSN
jgi:hypothetical protein